VNQKRSYLQFYLGILLKCCNNDNWFFLFISDLLETHIEIL